MKMKKLLLLSLTLLVFLVTIAPQLNIKVELVRGLPIDGTFGKTSVGGTIANVPLGYAFAFRLQAPECGTANMISAYIKGRYTSGLAKAMIYSDVSGQVGSLLAENETALLADWAWHNFTVDYSLEAGEYYWFGIFASVQLQTTIDPGLPNHHVYAWGWEYPNNPADFGGIYGPVYASEEDSIYVTYTPSHFWVDPPFMDGTPAGKFQIDIRVTDAPPSYSWEISLRWNPDRLELVLVKEDDFLHRGGAYLTDLAYVPLDEANAEGEIMISCVIVPRPGEIIEYPDDWASGDGSLCTLGFLVQAEGAAHLDLSDTRLWDHLDEEGYPAYTYYDNVDGLVDATGFFYAGLAGWKLKINGKAGVSVGGGLKTTVGTENLLEAMVKNTGNFDVYVQVFFEIRDRRLVPIGPPIEADQGIVLLAPEESTTFSTGWTADDPDVYYISAYSVYGPTLPFNPPFPIADGFSRTVRLKAVS